MADVQFPNSFLLNVNPKNTLDFLLKPALNYDNVLQSALKCYEIMPGVKDKKTMLHLHTPSNMLAAKTGCSTWSPTITNTLSANEISVSGYEVMGEQCADEFDAQVVRNLQGAGNMVNDPAASGELNALEMAQLGVIRNGLSNDVYKTSWFGATNFNQGGYHLSPDLSKLPSAAATRLENMLRVRNGWWSEIRAAVAAGLMESVDTNDGTAGGNYTNSANVTTLFDAMIDRAKPVLRNWNRNAPRDQWPCFLVQRGVFNAYKQLRASQGWQVPDAYNFMINGEPVRGVLEYDGFPVIECVEWDLFDDEIGQNRINGHSQNQRVLFIAPKVLTLAIDIDEVPGMPGTGLAIQQSPLLKDKMVKWLYMALRFGQGIAHYDLCVAGWNSSTTYA